METTILMLATLLAAPGAASDHGERQMKRMLGKARLMQARQFVMTQARPLDRALYQLQFEGGSAEAVLAELRAYQNPDGGFGKALEPDLRAPESSVLATLQAFHVFRALAAPSDHPAVKRALDYLAATFADGAATWRIIPRTAGSHPHAPWWAQETLDKTFGGGRIIPRAEVLAYLWTFAPSSFPLDRRLAVTRALVSDLESASGPDLAAGLEGCARLYECNGLPAEVRQRLHARLVALIPVTVEQDPAKWPQYCLKPLWLARTPESPFAGLLAESIARNLDYEIEQQAADGSWRPNWSWYGSYPETWPAAEREWSGALTVRTLETLRAFGRLER